MVIWPHHCLSSVSFIIDVLFKPCPVLATVNWFFVLPYSICLFSIFPCCHTTHICPQCVYVCLFLNVAHNNETLLFVILLAVHAELISSLRRRRRLRHHPRRRHSKHSFSFIICSSSFVVLIFFFCIFGSHR